MSYAAAVVKLARAARLSAEAAKLYAEASEELSTSDEQEETFLVPTLSEVDVARARRALRRKGARLR